MVGFCHGGNMPASHDDHVMTILSCGDDNDVDDGDDDDHVMMIM